MIVGEQGAAGKCLETVVERWLRSDIDGTHLEASDERFVELSRGAEQVPPGSDRLLFLPWLNGAGPPVSDNTARGGFLNQSLRSDAAHAYRAVLEGVAYNLRWMNSSIERLIGRSFATLNFIGGGARSALWCQILADVMYRPIRQVAEPTWAIVRGAALAGFVALDQIDLHGIAECVTIAKTYSPSIKNQRIHDTMFNAFLRAYKVNRRLFAQLNATDH